MTLVRTNEEWTIKPELIEWEMALNLGKWIEEKRRDSDTQLITNYNRRNLIDRKKNTERTCSSSLFLKFNFFPFIDLEEMTDGAVEMGDEEHGELRGYFRY
jgi:hypothetical protein